MCREVLTRMQETNTTYIQNQIKRITDNKIGLFLIHYLLEIINLFLLFTILYTTTLKFATRTREYTFNEKIILYVILAPILETILFIFLPRLILNKIKINNSYINLLIISTLFTLAHQHFEILSIIFYFILCLTFTNYYLQVQKRESTKKAIFKTILLHAFYNLTITIIW